jgi:hypothetical protein
VPALAKLGEGHPKPSEPPSRHHFGTKDFHQYANEWRGAKIIAASAMARSV